MPNSKIQLVSDIEQTFRTAQVAGMFDLQETRRINFEASVNIPVENTDWQIGLIVGPSGSGKTTIGRTLFPEAYFHEGYDWPESKAVVDGFPADLDAQAITGALSAVGFSSPPSWLKRYNHLSNGQKFRCELARLMLEEKDTIIVDEFSSVIDRDAAKISSSAVQKALRRRGTPRLIALSCHYDVIDWLDPDWVFNTATMTFEKRLLRQRPAIDLSIHKTTSAAWSLFRQHHYLDHDLSKAAQCFVATWNGTPVAFSSYLHFVHGTVRNAKREHRSVCLPDFQGVGIGNALSEWVGQYVLDQGFRYFSTTSHPAMIRHRCRSPKWKLRRLGHTATGSRKDKLAGMVRSCSRATAGFEFVGSPGSL